MTCLCHPLMVRKFLRALGMEIDSTDYLGGTRCIFYKKKFLQSLWVGLHKYNNSLLRPCTFLQIGFWRSPKVPSICDGVEQRQCGDASCWGQSGCWEDSIKQWEIPPHIFYHFIILLVYTLSFLDIVFRTFLFAGCSCSRREDHCYRAPEAALGVI